MSIIVSIALEVVINKMRLTPSLTTDDKEHSHRLGTKRDRGCCAIIGLFKTGVRGTPCIKLLQVEGS